MKITIKENESPHLKKTEMICDNGLAQKLNKYEMLTHLNTHSCNLLIGKPSSGKTSLLVSLFSSRDCLKKVFHKIYLFQPASSGSSIKNNIFDVIPEEQKFDELTEETLEDCFTQIKELDKDLHKAIIFDDMASYLKNKELQKMFKNICYNRRHHGISIFFLSQTYYSVPKELRKVFTNIIVFKTSKMELQTIMEEQVEMDKSFITPLSKLVFDKQYNFLFINTTNGKLYKNFDSIILEEEEDEEK